MDEAIFKFVGEAVKGGYALPFIGLYIWDKWKDREEKKDLMEKKKNGDFVSWESMDARLKIMESKVNGSTDKLLTFEKDLHGQILRMNLEEGRFTKLELGHDHLKENISDVKEVLQEIKNNQKDIFALISDMKNALIRQGGH